MGLKAWKKVKEIKARMGIKSDQNGIESSTPDMLLSGSRTDKIRPKWDWKTSFIAPSDADSGDFER